MRPGKLVLPDLRAFGNDSVAVFSDYGGEGSGSYNTYSALICGFGYTSVFHQKMRAIRGKHSLGEKEIAFKDLGIGPLRRAIPEYLAALDDLPGLLCTLAVDKRLPTLFGPQEKLTRTLLRSMLQVEGFGELKPNVAEKLLRIVHFSVFLAALSTQNGQRIFWMTDNDAVCETEAAHKDCLKFSSAFCRSTAVRVPHFLFLVVHAHSIRVASKCWIC